jgi:hypothetical protein
MGFTIYDLRLTRKQTRNNASIAQKPEASTRLPVLNWSAEFQIGMVQ